MIIIPMAGNSRRFSEAGYKRPKYELLVGPETLFSLTVRSFEYYFQTEHFVFICRSDFGAEPFVRAECLRMGIVRFDIVSIAAVTRGQAETVLIGLEACTYEGAESLVIFNIDTIRHKWRFPEDLDFADGYLEVFSGPGNNWSFVQPAAPYSRRVARTTEKERISDFCSSGLYHFARISDFTRVCREAIDDIGRYQQRWSELYIAPLYNNLIAAGKTIVYHHVSAQEIGFSGTPDEYEALRLKSL